MGFRFSVVIPTRNRPVHLAKLLESLSTQTFDRPFEVIVCDDCSDVSAEETVAFFEGKIPHLKCVRSEAVRGPAAARNLGVKVASGELIVFLDDDVTANSHYLTALNDHLRRNGDKLAGVCGRIISESSATSFLNPMENTLQADGTHFMTANVAYQRSAIQAVGGFDENFKYPICEDFDLAFRILKRVGPIGFEPNMLVTHAYHGKRTLWEVFQKRRRSRLPVIRLFLKNPEQFPPSFLPRKLHWLYEAMSQPTLMRLWLYFVLNSVMPLVGARALARAAPLDFLRLVVVGVLDLTSLVLESLFLLSRTGRHQFEHRRRVSEDKSFL